MDQTTSQRAGIVLTHLACAARVFSSPWPPSGWSHAAPDPGRDKHRARQLLLSESFYLDRFKPAAERASPRFYASAVAMRPRASSVIAVHSR